MNFSAVSLFSGCGGSDLGLKKAGIETVWANEIDHNACEMYQALVGPGIIRHRDVRTVSKFPKADFLVGCYPCTGFSQAGRRKNSDGINFLYREFDRALRQIKPLAFIVENVNGMRFSQNSHLLRNQLVRFRSAGYRVSWQVLDAKDYGLAQDRKRLIMVGIRSKEDKEFLFPAATHGPNSGRKFKTLRDTIWHLRNAPEGSYDPSGALRRCQIVSRNVLNFLPEFGPCVAAGKRNSLSSLDLMPTMIKRFRSCARP